MDSSDYETTYSQDERIETHLKHARQAEKTLKDSINLQRQILFENYLNDRNLDFFHFNGLKIITFNHLKIKFSFEPALVANCVSDRIKFYCSIRFDGKYWNIKRNTIPVNYKKRLYTLFYYHRNFTVEDHNIFHVLEVIHKILVDWSMKHAKFRQQRFQRYLEKQDIILDSDEEELFLDLPARVKLHQKRARILKRMLPPRN